MEDVDFTVDVSLLTHNFVKVEKKLREAELIEGRIVALQVNCEEVNPLSTKLYLSDLKTQFVPRRKHSLPWL